MKFEAEFRDYLTTVYVSSRTGDSITPKAAGDQLSRCRRIESHFQLELGPGTMTPDSKMTKIINQIKSDGPSLGATEKRPYGYLALVCALRLYRKFLDYRRN